MKLSRRQTLASLLGIPLAMTACRRSMAIRYTGSIVGGNDSLGHRLRNPNALPAPSGVSERVGVVIVGAGPSGLSAAWRLARAGFGDYRVIELEDAVGGTSRWGRNHVSAFPWGAHYVPTPGPGNRALIALLQEMGVIESIGPDGRPVVGETYLVRDLDERLFYNGRWYEGLYLYEGATREDLRQLRAFQNEIDRWVAWRDRQGRRAFALPMAHSSNDPEVTALDRMSMDEWMRSRGLTSPRLRWLVDYACRDDYGLRIENTSAWAGLFYFASRIPEPGSSAEELITFPEGNGRLVSHLAAVSEGKIHTGQLVTDIAPLPDGTVQVTVFHSRTNLSRTIRCDQVIVALPKFVALRIVAPWRNAPPPHLNAFTYSPWMVANLTLRDRPRSVGVEMAWDNVLYDSPSLGYVCATHQSLRDHGPTVLTYYLPLTGRNVSVERSRLLHTSWRQWVEFILSDLSRAHPDLDRLIQSVDVYRWGHGMVRPVPGFLWGPARRAAAEPITSQIFFAHSDLSGLALFEEAQYWGIHAAEQVLRVRGIPFDPMV